LYHVITILYLQRWNKSSKRPRGRKTKSRTPENPYYPLKKQILRETIGSHAEPVLAVLIQVGVIESDNHYVVGKYSKVIDSVSHTTLPRSDRSALANCRAFHALQKANVGIALRRTEVLHTNIYSTPCKGSRLIIRLTNLPKKT
jgi:hypothetical protein